MNGQLVWIEPEMSGCTATVPEAKAGDGGKVRTGTVDAFLSPVPPCAASRNQNIWARRQKKPCLWNTRELSRMTA